MKWRYPGCLFASHLSNNLLITDIGLDCRLSDEEDHNAHHQRDDGNATNPRHPLLIGQQTRPGTRKGDVDSIPCGDRSDDCAQVEHPIGRHPYRLKPLVETLPDDDHIDKEDHHRDTPDHGHGCLQDIIHHRREIGWFKASRQGVGHQDEGQDGEKARDAALHQHGHPGHAVAVDFAHHGGQTPIQARHEEQSSEGIVIHCCVEDEEADEDDVDQEFQRLGGKIPRGILLVGPPGTGKTLLARAVAGEAGVPFFSMSGSEFVEVLVGVGASRVRDLFDQAKKASPSIIFIDEIDAVGRQRGSSINSNDEREQTLNQLLVEMDGFDVRQAVVVIAATNRPDGLDKALLRPGRFDRRVTVERPDWNGRLAILKIHSKGVPLASDVDLITIARATPGMVGADLANLINEAALLAARRNLDAVTQSCFDEALDKILIGAERPLILSEHDLNVVAYHEGGHALTGLLTEEVDPVTKVTIVPRGQALGVTQYSPLDDRYNYSKEYLEAQLVTALGGRAAEEVAIGQITTGAENDLQRVTAIARQMVTRWGMSERLGTISYSEREDPFAGTALATGSREYSEKTATVIDEEVNRMVKWAYDQAVTLLTKHRETLDRIAKALRLHETLDARQLRTILEETGSITSAPASYQ